MPFGHEQSPAGSGGAFCIPAYSAMALGGARSRRARMQPGGTDRSADGATVLFRAVFALVRLCVVIPSRLVIGPPLVFVERDEFLVEHLLFFDRRWVGRALRAAIDAIGHGKLLALPAIVSPPIRMWDFSKTMRAHMRQFRKADARSHGVLRLHR